MLDNDMLKSFSQRDQAWANLTLKPSKLTMGRFGCTTTCIADLSTYFGDNLNPAQVNAKIKYTADGLIIWQSCSFNTFVFERREFGRNEKNIKAALQDPNRAVILQVASGSHWVVCIGEIAGIFKIADPWLGDKSSMARYNNNITGAAYFKRK